MNESVREALANEEKTKRNALTKSDRKLLKSYFGFTRCHQIPDFPVRDKKTACDFIKRMLFDDNDEKDAEKSKSAKQIDNDETAAARRVTNRRKTRKMRRRMTSRFICELC